MIMVSGEQRRIGLGCADIVLFKDDDPDFQPLFPARPSGRWISGDQARKAVANGSVSSDIISRAAWTVLDLVDIPSTDLIKVAEYFAQPNLFVAIANADVEVVSALILKRIGLLVVPDLVMEIERTLTRKEEAHEISAYTVKSILHSRSTVVELDACSRMTNDGFLMMDDGVEASVLLSSPARSPAFRLPMLDHRAAVLCADGEYIKADQVHPGQSLRVSSRSRPSGQIVVGRVNHKETEIATCSVITNYGDLATEIRLPFQSGVLLSDGRLSRCSDLTTGSQFLGARHVRGPIIGRSEEGIPITHK